MKIYKTFSLINSIAFLLVMLILISNATYPQDINGKLGTGGQFIIRDTTNTFLTLSQSTGNLTLNRSLILPSTSAGSQLGTIFKGTNRFLHTYYGIGTTGNNTFLGINSGNFTLGGLNFEGSNNTAVGFNSLSSLTTGYINSAFGIQSLTSNTSGVFNSAFGGQSLSANTTGSENSAFGREALVFNTTGSYNSAFGRGSLYSNTTGNYNTALGINAGSVITTGSNNTAIGYDAQVPSGTASNQIRLGNTSITYAGIQVAWTVTSDRNLKSNILPLNLGLNFISKLNPVSYTRKNDESQKTEYGLIAQEIEEVLKQEGIENAGMLKITDEGEYQLRYNDLIAPMIKAIQELNDDNEKKDKKIAELEIQLNNIMQVINELKQNHNYSNDVKLTQK